MPDERPTHIPAEALWLLVLLCVIGVGCNVLYMFRFLGDATSLVLIAGGFCIAAVLARMWVLGRRAQRLNHGQCFACGYDVRASIGRCPECGQAIEPPPNEDRG